MECFQRIEPKRQTGFHLRVLRDSPRKQKAVSRHEVLISKPNGESFDSPKQKRGSAMYKVFARTWWTNNPDYPNGLEPSPGRKTTIKKGIATEEAAKDICRVWNANHKPGRLSRKAEYEET